MNLTITLVGGPFDGDTVKFRPTQTDLILPEHADGPMHRYAMAADGRARQACSEGGRPAMRGFHIMRGDGCGTTIYFGRHRGARFIGVDLRGFNGWSSSRRMPGGWEFYNPTVCVGRLFADVSRSYSRRVLIPARIVRAKRMLNRDYRPAMSKRPKGGYGYSYPRNGGHRTKMYGDPIATLSQHHDPVCRTCPTCVRYGSCKEHPVAHAEQEKDR